MVAVAGERRGLWRSRWAAIGAAVAVTLGGGGMVAVNAAASPASSVVTIDPVRILDTRTDVGLPGPFVSAVSQKLKVTGAVPTSTGTQTPVPVGATGVLLNVTVVGPSANGFLSVRPGDATGVASTSSLNFNAGDLIPNSVQVGLPTSGANAGQIDITYDAYGTKGPTTEVLIDVVGYMVAGGGGATGPAGAQLIDFLVPANTPTIVAAAEGVTIQVSCTGAQTTVTFREAVGSTNALRLAGVSHFNNVPSFFNQTNFTFQSMGGAIGTFHFTGMVGNTTFARSLQVEITVGGGLPCRAWGTIIRTSVPTD